MPSRSSHHFSIVILFCINLATAQIDINKFSLSASTTVPSTTPTPVPVPVVVPVPTPVPTPTPNPFVPTPSTQPILDVTQAAAQSTNAPGQCVPPFQYLQQRGGTNVFLTAVQQANLTGFLNSKTAVQTIFAPVDSAFVNLLASQGIRESQLYQNQDKLQKLLQNHFLPNVNVKMANMVIGASWPTVNPNQKLTVASQVAPAIVGADLQACNTLLQETNVVLVPADVLPLGPGAGTATAAVVIVPAPPPPPVQVVAVVQAVPVAQPTAKPSYSSSLDVTRININTGGTGRVTSPTTGGGRNFYGRRRR